MTEDKEFKRLEYEYRGKLTLKEHKLSELASKLGPNDILVKVKAAAINPIDIILYNSAPYIFFKRHTNGFGRDFSGVVEKLGSGVTGLQVGDRIAGLHEETFVFEGTFSEYFIYNVERSRHNFGKIPDNLSFNEAASFPLVFGTAYSSLQHAHKPNPKTRAIVYGGATSVGSFVIQLLKNFYNAEYVVSVNSEASLAKIQGFGVDSIINYKTQDVAKESIKLVEESGEKFDIIIDTVGTNVFFPVIDKILKPKSENSGYVTIVGDHVADYHSSLFKMFSVSFMKRLLLPKSYNYKLSGIDAGKWFDLAISLYEEGKLNMFIDSVYPLEKYQDAINRLIDHKAAGKVVISLEE